MVSAIKTQVIRIGNSQGIRIPKVLIEQCGLHSEVELAVQEDCLVVRPASRPREGWEEACIEMVKNGDDSLLDGAIATTWDNAEWEW
ncbi:MAG: AbrB/MazE/SpoVT family DNA-binding domain-containing protein [Leptolyngbya foveolarum]|uniref:AbrB/MazE/SpoVT family DNA-binding domain-containing protein n=1 Tax=Leptolyngbya foveolarum TaxID=47253 RepID=A0A2W4W692_9CYAN|nr:MAG: AbrB/MazE/SpoVT family DNA-binding domain-containing protein [Leptolyngbya foveolarum]